MPARSPLPFVLACAALAGCVQLISPRQVDQLVRELQPHTVVVEDGFTLYSPYDPIMTNAYVNVVRAQRAEVFALLGVEKAAPTLVTLHPNPGLGSDIVREDGGLAIREPSTIPDGPLRGFSSGDAMVIEVDPPHVLAGELPLTIGFDPSMFEGTIRHEFVHIALTNLGVQSAGWCQEGMARALQWTTVVDGRLSVDPASSYLRAAAELPHEWRSLAWLLAWQGDLTGSPEQIAAQFQSFAFVLFLLERDGAPTLREGLARMRAHTDEELLALQDDWSAWLERFAGPPEER